MILTTKKYSVFSDWNIDMILFARNLSSPFPLVKLEKIITPRKERIKPEFIPSDSAIVAKIRFSDGQVFFKDRSIKNDMAKSCLNDLIVSNINFEKGAFAINTWGDVFASTDYTSYILDTRVIIPEFLFLALRCNLFMDYITSVKPKGMKTRARYDFIKNFEIPLPSISEQEKLLSEYYANILQATNAQKQGDNFSFSLLNDIQSMVSDYTMKPDAEETGDSILQIVPFSDTRRWEVGYILKEGRLETIYNSFKFKMYSISELQVDSLFGLSDKASVDQKKGMIPVLRMSNVVNGEIVYSDFKYLPKDNAISDKEPTKWLLSDGDFLITRTNGSKDLVGKSAVFHSDGIYTYASYLIRYRFDTEIVLPDYINILFMTPIVREQIAVMRRQGGGQYNLNSDEIGAIRIPVPSIQEQKAIIEKYYSTKDGANTYYQEANRLKEKAASDFEQAIFS